MRKLIFVLAIAGFGLSSCGGDENTVAPPPPAPPGGGPVIASIDLITDNPQIPSDGGIPAAITAFVKDADNNFVEGVDVSFAADSGGIVVTEPTTSATGTAAATLSTAGDPTNRIITVTATAGEVSQTLSVFVTGSQLTITGPDSLVQGDDATYTIVLVDGGGQGIPGVTVDVTSRDGNVLEASTLTTDATGQAQVQLTATQGGDDVITATGLDLSASRTITVSDDNFAFKSPGENAEIDLGAVQVLTVEWLKDGVPQANEVVTFSTTRGEFVGLAGPPQITTNAAGEASISVSADNAGPAIVSAVADGGPTTQLPIEFVATVPASLELQASPFTIAPGNQSTLTAIVRDPDNNRVKNARVQFSLQDVTGGTLSVGAADTDSQGRAQTFYTASDTVSGNQGVTVTASIENDNSINDAVALTVARRELFLAFGTGNTLVEPDEATYSVPFVGFVTDSEGNGVPDASVQFDVRSVRYSKGIWVLDAAGEFWVPWVRATCDDEDINGNGILDDDEIDVNNNGTIEAGNVVAVVGAGTPTDADGRVAFSLSYPQLYGAWTEIRLRGQVSVGGTEFSEDLEFVLQVLADDVEADQSPPGLLKPPDEVEFGVNSGSFVSSPWGYSDACANDY